MRIEESIEHRAWSMESKKIWDVRCRIKELESPRGRATLNS